VSEPSDNANNRTQPVPATNSGIDDEMVDWVLSNWMTQPDTAGSHCDTDVLGQDPMQRVGMDPLLQTMYVIGRFELMEVCTGALIPQRLHVARPV
jgi:hypothetical protein